MSEVSGQFDVQSARRIAAATRYVEAMRKNDPPAGARPGREENFHVGKPDTAFAAGVLAAPNNVVSVWLGPAWGGSDVDTGLNIPCDYAFAAVATTQWVAVTRYRGKWYVTPLSCV